MPLRMAVTKVSGQGEQIVVDVCQWNPVTGKIEHESVSDVISLMEDGLSMSDDRLYEMNMRMLEAYQLETYFTPGTWQQVVSILDILAGRTSAQDVKRRWDSIKEENKELEEGRRNAAILSCKESPEAYLDNSGYVIPHEEI